ncbi:MAG: tRNA (adenosine(37)-N6)-threonylcarbamoyltransferase complex ATPase subunit type 1 TsaE [Bacteroidales bacterium]|nr:tRNA (adenosine(37)-N6)-threonylcarbamoyltransferase complex ATPase subunit type 1 TsaE [Bacteroidales bacterium]MDD2611203.1 tRNA (adenosine(37)-N6)-threonylcarbamoyltransferase complex ATPase subunit type 1 TsaE [Bacteroidales bacterium]MDD3906593.1 tRNA (adenosine(37)-N6)-threonylcarbamoyltransferase complex ATPase subunit type 1 TsaE [Bacteroidales bacterium]MDD4711822.1 tRNA (adenosine(37)-N6)-threonylcarbamoyltransferase complex ATPase subunit type 1 TsaE [Bacteroidales bacterium]
MTLEITSLNQIRQTAKDFLQATEGKTVFAFYGLMGAGKTSFIKAICEELGVKDVINSPTFAIVNEYSIPNGGSIYHFDFYRIQKLEEAFDLGYEEYFYSGEYCFIEWPEMIESLLPENCLAVHIKEMPDGKREINFEDIQQSAACS